MKMKSFFHSIFINAKKRVFSVSFQNISTLTKYKENSFKFDSRNLSKGLNLNCFKSLNILSLILLLLYSSIEVDFLV